MFFAGSGFRAAGILLLARPWRFLDATIHVCHTVPYKAEPFACGIPSKDPDPSPESPCVPGASMGTSTRKPLVAWLANGDPVRMLGISDPDRIRV